MKLFTLFWRNWLNPKERKLKAVYIVTFLSTEPHQLQYSDGGNFIEKAIAKAIISERNVPLVIFEAPLTPSLYLIYRRAIS